jgi:AcrR family transcriptional regulator
LQIVQAALAAIAERGFQDTRITDIAERAGATPPAVLYHFESKEEILEAAVALAEDTFYAEVEAALAEPNSASERLLRLLERGGRDDSSSTVAMWKVWLEIWTRALRDRHTARTRHVLDRRWRAMLASTIRGGQAHGEFDADADAELVALQLASLMDGLAIQFALEDPDVSGERMSEVLIATGERMLGCDLGPHRKGGASAKSLSAHAQR